MMTYAKLAKYVEDLHMELESQIWIDESVPWKLEYCTVYGI